MANLKFGIRPDILQGANLSSVHSSDNEIYITYDNFYPDESHRVSQYKIMARLSLSNVTVNDDLSIEFDYGGIQSVRANTNFSSAPVGYSVEKTLFRGSDNAVVWKQTDDIAASFDSHDIPVTTQPIQHYKVPANGTISIPEVKAFGWLASARVSDGCDVYVGGTVSNIIPDYKPNGIRKNGEWKSVQELKLSTYIRTSGNWNDVGTELVATAGHVNKGKTRRRQNGEWLQEVPFS